MRPLLSDSQLGALQKVALSSFRVKVIITRPVFTSDDLGDDAFDENPAVVEQPESVLRDGDLYGYMAQTTGATVGQVDAGQITTMSTFDLALPIGTNVLPRDIATIFTKGGVMHEFFIQDVQDDETWPALLDCVVRALA